MDETSNYNSDVRLATPTEEDLRITQFEVVFDIPTHITRAQQGKLMDLFDEIVKSPLNQPKDGVHWLAGMGSKPTFSKQDAAFLGKPADPDAPDDGEPSFDDNVLQYHTTSREFLSDRERGRVEHERAVNKALHSR